MFEEMGTFTREELFDLFKLYTEKGLNAIGAGNLNLEIACDKGRAACFQAIEELNRKSKFDPSKRIGT